MGDSSEDSASSGTVRSVFASHIEEGKELNAANAPYIVKEKPSDTNNALRPGNRYRGHTSTPESFSTSESRTYMEACIGFANNFIYLICILSVLCSIFIAEIIVASVYRLDIICDGATVEPYTWLLVEGSVGMLWILLLLIMSHSSVSDGQRAVYRDDDQKMLSRVTHLLIILVSIFRFAWLVVGSVVLWNPVLGCPNLEPKPVDTMIWIAVLSSYIAIFLRLIQRKDNLSDL